MVTVLTEQIPKNPTNTSLIPEREVLITAPKKPLQVPRLLMARVIFDMPEEGTKRVFPLDWNNVRSDTPSAIFAIASFLEREGFWDGAAPGLAVLERSARQRDKWSQMRQQNDRFIGQTVVVNAMGSANLEILHTSPLELERLPLSIDGAAVAVDADDLRVVTAPHLGQGLHFTFGQPNPDSPLIT